MRDWRQWASGWEKIWLILYLLGWHPSRPKKIRIRSWRKSKRMNRILFSVDHNLICRARPRIARHWETSFCRSACRRQMMGEGSHLATPVLFVCACGRMEIWLRQRDVDGIWGPWIYTSMIVFWKPWMRPDCQRLENRQCILKFLEGGLGLSYLSEELRGQKKGLWNCAKCRACKRQEVQAELEFRAQFETVAHCADMAYLKCSTHCAANILIWNEEHTSNEDSNYVQRWK